MSAFVKGKWRRNQFQREKTSTRLNPNKKKKIKSLELDNKTDVWNAKRLYPTILKIQRTQFKIYTTKQHPPSPHIMNMSQPRMHGHELELKHQTQIPNNDPKDVQ